MTQRFNSAMLVLFAATLTACGGADSAPKVQEQASSSPQATPAAAKKELTPMERGAKLAKRCKVCHSFEDGGANKVGPNLWSIWGSPSAKREGFQYSKAMTEANVTWDDTSLDAYIANPKEFIPGNRMSFVGVKKAEDRADLLLYLKAQTTP